MTICLKCGQNRLLAKHRTCQREANVNGMKMITAKGPHSWDSDTIRGVSTEIVKGKHGLSFII